MTKTFRRAALAAVMVSTVAAAALAPSALAQGGGEGLPAVGLFEGTVLVGFFTDSPDRAVEIGHFKGLEGDESIVGIDYRVQDGELYGVGDAGGIYVIDDETAAVTKVRQLSVALEGEFFGVDFNPAADALRIISDTGQNLRQPFATEDAPTAVDGELTNPAVAPATGTVRATGVTGAAYTNNDLDASTATTLFDLDTALDRVAIQSPANAGTLAPTGNLPTDVGPNAGFDIYSALDAAGMTTTNSAFAVVTVDNTQRLWRVNVLTGRADEPGAFIDNITDIAIKLATPAQ